MPIIRNHYVVNGNLNELTIAAAVAASEHLTYHVVKNSSMSEIQQLNISVKTNGYVKTSTVAHLHAQ